MQLESIVQFLNTILQDGSVATPRVRALRDRAVSLHFTWTNQSVVSSTCTGSVRRACSVVPDGSSRGRPKLRINLDQVELLRSAGLGGKLLMPSW